MKEQQTFRDMKHVTTESLFVEELKVFSRELYSK